MDSIPVGGGLIPWCIGRGHEVGIEEGGQKVLKVIFFLNKNILKNIIK
jgi:hypothetical protein